MTLGWKGLIRRIKGANRGASSSYSPPPGTFTFPAPAPIEAITLQVGVMAHVFYPDLLDEFEEQLSLIPLPFVLLVSVVSEMDKDLAVTRLSGIKNVSALHVRVVPNRGRDIAPMMLTYRKEILELDLVGHIHTKKSLYTGVEQGGWRKYLVRSLFGSRERLSWILGMFQATPELGMVYPDSFEAVPLWAHTWLSNKGDAKELGERLGISIDGNEYLDFATGSMFWARVDALRPVYDLGLHIEDFPEEAGQTDATLQHALERLIAQVVRNQKMVLGILPRNHELMLNTEGDRNWKSYFDIPVADRISIAAIDASTASFDLFDTLVLRPFLTPFGARAYLAWLVKRRFGLEKYAALRDRAEMTARLRLGQDPDTIAIYEAFAELVGIPHAVVELIRQLELETERRLLRPRSAILSAAQRLLKPGKSVVAISDMYFGKNDLSAVLPPQVTQSLQEIYVSCDTGWRKDTKELWQKLPLELSLEPSTWLHTGDNEHSDVQLPHDLGFMVPVHVLRPSALLDVVPALRPLRLSPSQAAQWPNQLSTGLICNRLTELADTKPRAFDNSLLLDDPETFGYVVLGPLVLDYVAWIGRLAVSESYEAILFLSREGFLLERAYRRMQESADANSVRGTYLLASRRGTGTPSLRSAQDLDLLLAGTYTGSLLDLLRSRMGDDVVEAARSLLGDSMLSGEVYLPEMRTTVIDMLRPIASRILQIAERERDAYLQYWADQVGDANAMVSDVGYAGTIQSHLCRLAGKGIGGAYFALDHRAAATLNRGEWARARYHDERNLPGNESLILKNDLLLETIFTAPTGQFSHFEVDGEVVRPIYRTETRTDIEVVSRIQSGVISFINDICTVVGPDVFEMELDAKLIQEPLRCLNAKLWKNGNWASALVVDDDFTGRGSVYVGGRE